jgi:hypothetical protein
MGLVPRSLRLEGLVLVGAMRFSLSRFSSGAFAVLVSCHAAIAAEAEFYSQCHKLFPVADDFAHECLQRARPFSRTFYPSGGSRGEVEAFSTYFKTLDAPSHFVLGCVLDFKHKISFAGLYYSAQPLDMARFNEYPIAFIDFDGNVGLKIDGAQHTLIAVRQFVTDVIPPRLRGRPQNCEDPRIETMNGSNATALHRFVRSTRTKWNTATAALLAKSRDIPRLAESTRFKSSTKITICILSTAMAYSCLGKIISKERAPHGRVTRVVLTTSSTRPAPKLTEKIHS